MVSWCDCDEATATSPRLALASVLVQLALALVQAWAHVAMAPERVPASWVPVRALAGVRWLALALARVRPHGRLRHPPVQS